MIASSSPIVEAERAEVLDALCGFALLGIVVTHIPGFSGYSFLSPADGMRSIGSAWTCRSPRSRSS
jgi:uncharacterized membrane protein YeiB